MDNINKVHRPQLPLRKPVKGESETVLPFMTKEASEAESYVVLATEPDLYHIMTAWLMNKRHHFVEVRGGYKMESSGEFVEENAVVVSRAVAIKIWQQGWIDTQESVLHLYNRDSLGRYRAELVFLNNPDKEDIDLGYLIQTTKEKALSNADGYTYKIDADQYYICYKPTLNEKD